MPPKISEQALEQAPEPAVDPAVERRLLRKMDGVLVTLVFVCYLLGFLDRSNIGNAETAGMSTDLGFGDDQYQWLLTIFYIPYIVFEWAALFWKIFPPHIWGAATVFVWGLASTLQAAAFNWAGLMACRFFLAMAEAAFSPGVPYLLSFFYRRHELGARCGVFLSAAPLATTFAGALAYGITSAQGRTALAPWRLLFLVEGLPTVAMAAVLYAALPDAPDAARFLTAAERAAARRRVALQTGDAEGEGRARLGLRGLRARDVLATLALPQTLVCPLMYFCCNVSFASLPVFLPTILTEMGFARIDAQGLTAPPYFLAFVVCIASTWAADRLRQRGLFVAGLSAAGGVGYVLLATARRGRVAVRYLGVFLAAAGVFPAIANILPWVLNNQATDTRRGVGIAALNLVGQCGPLLGTRLFPARDKPYYTRGMAVCAAFLFANALLALALRQYFVVKNRQLAEAEAAAAAAVEGAAAPAGGDAEKGGVFGADPLAEREGTLGYRYIL